MADLCDVAYVENNYRPLRGQEENVVPSWITGMSSELKIRVPGIEARVAADEDYAELVRKTIMGGVDRMLRRTLVRAEPVWNYFSQAEIDRLTVASGSGSSFTITPVGADPGYRTDWVDEFST